MSIEKNTPLFIAHGFPAWGGLEASHLSELRAPSGAFCLRAPIDPDVPEHLQIGSVHIDNELIHHAALSRVILVDFSCEKWASRNDVLTAAKTLGLSVERPETADLLSWLSTEQALIQKLIKKGFDGVIGMDLTRGTDPSRFVVAFDESNLRVLQGVERKIAVHTLEHFHSCSPADWTEIHSRLADWAQRATGLDRLKETIANIQRPPNGEPMDLNAIDSEGREILLFYGAHSPQAIQVLLDHGVDPKGKNSHLSTILHRLSDDGAVPLLVERGADIHAVDKDGNTPLHEKARTAFFSCAEAFIAAGADVNATNRTGKTPLHLLSENHESDPQGVVHFFNALRNAGADLDARDQKGRTPLHLAAEHHCPSMILSLVKAGCNIDAEDDFGLKPLHMAVKRENLAMHILVALGANPWGVAASRDSTEDRLREPPLRAALRVTGTCAQEVLTECLQRFPEVKPSDEKWAQALLKKTKGDPRSAILSAHMARQAIDSSLGSLSVCSAHRI